MESIAIGKNLAATNGYDIDAGQEMLALGIANVVGVAWPFKKIFFGTMDALKLCETLIALNCWWGMYEHAHDNTPTEGPIAQLICQDSLLRLRCSCPKKTLEIELESPNHQLLGFMFHINCEH